MKVTMWKKIASLLVLATAVVGAARTATATTGGGAGEILEFRVNTASNSAYPYYRAHIDIGGTLCFSGGNCRTGVEELSGAELQLLATFMVHNRVLNPTYEKAGVNKCLSSFYVDPRWHPLAAPEGKWLLRARVTGVLGLWIPEIIGLKTPSTPATQRRDHRLQ